MRISNNLIHRAGVETIHAQQSRLMHLFQQVSTGRRIVTPSDDPLAAARTINLGQAEAQNTRFSANREIAKQSLNLEEDVLKTVVLALQDVRTRLIEAGNGSYTDKDRQNLATDLHHAYDLLANQANAKDNNGQYLFSGSTGGVSPYTLVADKWVLDAGNLIAGDRNIQVDQTRQLSSSDMAEDVFRAAGKDLFLTLDAVITALQDPVDDNPPALAALEALRLSTIGDLDAIYDNVLTVRTSVGARLNEIEALDNNGSLRHLNYRKELSSLEDADYYEATSMLTLRQAALEAATMAFRRIQSTSLFSPQG